MESIDISNIFTGQKIQFINNKVFFQGTVIRVHSNYFAVSISIDQHNYSSIKLNDTTDYLIVYKDTAFKCKSKILGCKVGDKVEVLLMSGPITLNSIERRKYPRIKVVMDVEYCLIADNLKNEKIEDIPRAYFRKLRKTFTVDLSANGIKIITYEDNVMPKYALISLFIKEQIYVLCSVVRTDYDEISKGYQTAVQFIDLDNNKWQYINEFVYSQLGTS